MRRPVRHKHGDRTGSPSFSYPEDKSAILSCLMFAKSARTVEELRKEAIEDDKAELSDEITGSDDEEYWG